jgi:cysteine desulfuration protein SufE
MNQVLKAREAELVEIFEWIEDDTDRYDQIIDMGKQLPPFRESKRTDEHEVKGCQSKVWLSYEFEEGKLKFNADSNTVITKGIIAILLYLWNDMTPQEIIDSDTEIIEKIGLRQHLTSQRNNGLTAMIMKIKAIAAHYKK